MTLSYTNTSYTSTSWETNIVLPVLVNTDIKIRLSGGAANSDPNASLGGAKSSTEIVNDTLHNIFDIVSSGEHTTGDIEFRCVYLHNSNSTTPINNLKIYISSESSASEDEWDLALGSSGINGTEQTILDENIPPLDITFSHPINELQAILVPTIPVGQHIALWFRRTVLAGSTTVSNVTVNIAYVFDER